MSLPDFKPRPITRNQAITDIISSVAQEQAAVAKILDAESDKLQKIVCTQVCPEQMLKGNKSVKSMVDSVVTLELILKAKLALFEDCLCEEHHKDGPCEEHHKDDSCQEHYKGCSCEEYHAD